LKAGLEWSPACPGFGVAAWAALGTLGSGMAGTVTAGDGEDPGAGEAFWERFGWGGSSALLHPAANNAVTAHVAKARRGRVMVQLHQLSLRLDRRQKKGPEGGFPLRAGCCRGLSRHQAGRSIDGTIIVARLEPVCALPYFAVRRCERASSHR
jgi:hypothetical protein